MAKIENKDIIEALKEKTILEVKELVDMMKEEFGVDPSAVAIAAAPALKSQLRLQSFLIARLQTTTRGSICLSLWVYSRLSVL